MSAASDDRGLGSDGRIRREGSLDRVAPAFGPVVADVRGLVAARLGTRLHSAYLYGSIPRGTAVPGISDLDAVILLRDDPPDTDIHANAADVYAHAAELADVPARRRRGDAVPADAVPADAAAVAQIAVALDERHEIIDGAGLLCWPVSRILDPAERYDLGFFLACLCTPLLGEDVARWLPRYRPTRRLARDTNGDITAFLDRARASLDGSGDIRRLCRSVTRKLVRTGFTLVMPRWGGWTSDLFVAARVFGEYYPAQAEAMAGAAVLARAPAGDAAIVSDLIGGLGGWLAQEYGRTVGVKAS
jgi:predicted nucleotidyltransferase